MRLWSIHPRHLDTKGLTACWREALLARAVLAGKTKGYRNHPQLDRFRAAFDPLAAIEVYLQGILAESVRRGFKYNASKVDPEATAPIMPVTVGQIRLERDHLLAKLRTRDPERAHDLLEHPFMVPPLFVGVPGDVETWERANNI